MAYEQQDNSFSAFLVPDDRKRDNGPVFSGTLRVGGQDYFIDVWENQVRSGDNAGQIYLGGKVKPKEARGGSRGSSDRGGSSRDGGGSRYGGGSTRQDGGASSGRGGGREETRYADDRGRPGSGGGRMNDVIDDDIPF